MIKDQYLKERRRVINELMEEGLAKMEKSDEEILELQQKIKELEHEIRNKKLMKDNALKSIRALYRYRVPYDETNKGARF